LCADQTRLEEIGLSASVHLALDELEAGVGTLITKLARLGIDTRDSSSRFPFKTITIFDGDAVSAYFGGHRQTVADHRRGRYARPLDLR